VARANLGHWAAFVNVTCEKCNKRYSIADDKVRGKSVKIRCKQCQNLISVQGPPVSGAVSAVAVTAAPVSSPAPAWEEERTRAMPALDLSPTWFAMVKGKQIGPMTLRDLETKVKSQEVSLRTYLWKQGMGDWKRASDVPEVSPVFAGVSVGASATGPTRAAPPAGKPHSKSTPSVARDVATANELPSPEITRGPRITAKSNGNGHGHGSDGVDPYERDARTVAAQPFPAAPARPEKPAVAKPLSGSRGSVSKTSNTEGTTRVPMPQEPATMLEPVVQAPRTKTSQLGRVELKPEPQVTLAAEPATRPGEHQPAPLNDLFNDIPISGQHPRPDSIPDVSTDPNSAAADARAADPFAALGEVQPGDLPPPGEATKFFIAQAGVNKRNPPWKIALFVFLGLGLPTGLLFLLSSLHVVPPVLVKNDKGEMVEQPFFSPQGLSVGIKDLLNGETKRKRQEADRQRAERAEAEAKAKAVAAREKNQGAEPDPTDLGGRRGDKAVAAKYTKEELAKLYGSGGPTGSDVDLGKKSDVGPKVHVDSSTPTVEKGGGLDTDAVSKVMAERMKAFTGCVEDALKRNPNVKLEKLTVVIEVASSGAVKGASLDPKRLELTDWGGCVRDKAKRIVFPAADGESQIEIPLVLGAQVN
jgi:predicted Zn finger-like uncharacterized protein